jgi:hypothetical protein
MDGLTFAASLVSSLAWPVVLLAITYLFRRELAEVIGRLRTVKALGAEGTFDPKEAEAKVALATATAAATIQAATTAPNITASSVTTYTPPKTQEMTERFMDLARRDPGAAVLEAWEEVERTLKRRMDTAKVAGIERLRGEQLIDLAMRKAVINVQTAEALRGLLVLRNLAAHDRDVGLGKALEYLTLADSVAYSINGTVFFTMSAAPSKSMAGDD